MKRPKYKVVRHIRFKDKSKTQTEYVYLIMEHLFWIFYIKKFKSVDKVNIERLMYQLTKPK